MKLLAVLGPIADTEPVRCPNTGAQAPNKLVVMIPGGVIETDKKGSSMLDIAPGKEDDFNYLRQWLAKSVAIERVIEATEAEENEGSSSGSGATDTVLSRPTASLRVPTVQRPATAPPHQLFGLPLRGGAPCGSTCT